LDNIFRKTIHSVAFKENLQTTTFGIQEFSFFIKNYFLNINFELGWSYD